MLRTALLISYLVAVVLLARIYKASGEHRYDFSF